MSTKGVKKSSEGKKKIKKHKIKSDTNATPRKKKKSKSKTNKSSKPKPKSDVLNKLKKRKKKSESTPKKKNAKSKDQSLKIKKKSKQRKSTFDPINNDSNSKFSDKSKSKGKKRRSSNNIDNIKKQLLAQSQSNTYNENKNMLPNSAKKILKSPPKKNKKQVSQVQSMKKTKDFQYDYNYNTPNSNSINPRRSISNMYGFGKKHKKKKSNEIIPPTPAKKKKNNNAKQIKKHKKKNIRKVKKKPVQPSSTEKLSLFRRKSKTKTKTKKTELLVIGDYIKISENKYGIIRYKGCLKNVTGIYYGVELLGEYKNNGDCDGIFNGDRYFKCDINNGIFVMYQNIECKMKPNEIENLLKKKVSTSSKRRSNTMTLSQRLTNKMIGSKKTKDKKNSKKNKKKISSKFSNKNKNKISSKFMVTDENGKKIKNLKGKKLSGKKRGKKRSNTIGTNDINNKENINTNCDDKPKKYKWDIPSKTPDFNGRHISNSQSEDMTMTLLSLDNVCENAANSTKPKRHSSVNIVSRTQKASVRGTFNQSDYGLQNILERGRLKNELSDNNNNENKGRTRSLSIGRRKKLKDNSWMTHKDENGNSSDRIKQNILQQKQLDLQGLMAVQSGKKKNDISKLFAKHIENANVTSAKNGMDTTDKNKLKDRLKNEQDALENAVEIVKDLGFLKYICNNEIYSKIYIRKCRKDTCNDDDDEKGVDYDLFDMNNIDILNKFDDKTRNILSKVICKAIISIPSIEILEMCNCDIDSNFMEILCDYLIENIHCTNITILSLQSNPITDNGMIYLTKLIKLNNQNLTTIKLQNNRKDISTLICQQICEALECNQYIIKFEFEFRHYQWRDFRDKVVKSNAEKARLIRLQMKKNLSV